MVNGKNVALTPPLLVSNQLVIKLMRLPRLFSLWIQTRLIGLMEKT